jgi:hypothetical protein
MVGEWVFGVGTGRPKSGRWLAVNRAQRPDDLIANSSGARARPEGLIGEVDRGHRRLPRRGPARERACYVVPIAGAKSRTSSPINRTPRLNRFEFQQASRAIRHDPRQPVATPTTLFGGGRTRPHSTFTARSQTLVTAWWCERLAH